MKFVRTVVVYDQGALVDSPHWHAIHETIVAALSRVVHPPGSDKFVIRRKARKVDVRGKVTSQWMRNGVVPIKEQFFGQLTALGWKSERKVPLAAGGNEPPSGLCFGNGVLIDYPSKQVLADSEDTREANLHRKVGDFDFYFEKSPESRCAIEWETGNISSTHRSMNKLCLVMMAGLIDFGVVVLPSRSLYAHLTDRIGNWMELSPYLPFWNSVGKTIKRGLLAVVVVEQDELTDDPAIPYISQGSDGRSAEGAAKLL